MRLTSNLLGLPASILFLITAHTATALHDDRLPANNSPDKARWVDESADQGDVEARDEQTQVPLGRSPVGVMKMSDDPGQKFYMHYWAYGEDLPQANTPDVVPPARLLRTRDEEEEAVLLANSSAAISYRAPFALHTDESFVLRHLEVRGRIPGRDASAALAALQKRQFACPTGTSDCSSIGYPNSCCATDETCFQIQDTGLGPVGCCPNGDSCGGTISGCNSPNTPCAEDQGGDYEGGGCCIPDYVCAGIGCIPSGSASTEVVGSTTTVVVVVTPTTTTTTTTTSTSSATTTSHGSVDTTTITKTVSGVAPARPTGSTTTAPPATTAPTGTCPTGFYACEAYNAGGCCRTGRDCATTDCPAVTDTTIVSSGVTIVVPVGPAATLSTPSGNCASGWSSCAASLGGNCCLSGWQCGTASCTSISPSSTEVGQKNAPSMGIRGVQSSAGLLICSLLLVLMCI